MNRREAFRVELLGWYTAMGAVGKAMPHAEMRELLDWETRNLNGCTVGTSDWPGWEKYIGQKPTLTDEDISSDRRGYVYLVRAHSGEYKIGRSKDVSARLRNLATSTPFEFELIHKISADDCGLAERTLHARFSEKKIRREWFQLDQRDVVDFSQLAEFSNGEFVKRPAQKVKKLARRASKAKRAHQVAHVLRSLPRLDRR
jgi:Meiotically Up-regulated Gene 113 (MUG113) protein